MKCSFRTLKWWKAAKLCLAQRLPPDSSVVSVLNEETFSKVFSLVLKERLIELASFLVKAGMSSAHISY